VRPLSIHLLLLIFATSCVARGADIKHVVLVSVDGLAADYLDNPQAQLPNLRALREAGASAGGMITTFPSVTWPAHVSLVTGTRPKSHGILANQVFDRRTRRPVGYFGDMSPTEAQAVRVPTLYDVAHAAGLKTAAVMWPCCNGSKSLDWIVPDAPTIEQRRRYTTTGLIQELTAADIPAAQLEAWGWQKQDLLSRDRLSVQIARFLLEKRDVSLLLVHLNAVDGVQHTSGPKSAPAYQAAADADAGVKQIWDSLQKAPLAGNSTLFVVSDHGFLPYTKLIQPNVLLRKLGLVGTNIFGNVNKRDAWSCSMGGAGFVYLFDEAAVARSAEIVAALKQLDGVESVLTSTDFARRGLPDPGDNVEMPQLILTARAGFSFGDATSGDPLVDAGGSKGTHGQFPELPAMHATFIAAGAGIKPGVRLKSIDVIDVAPTIARLLGLKLPAEGRVLEDFLAR